MAEERMECLALGEEVGLVLDLEAAAVRLKAPCCQQKAEAHQILPLTISRRRSRVSSAAVVGVGDLGLRHSTMLSLYSVEREEGLRISLLLQLAAVLWTPALVALEAAKVLGVETMVPGSQKKRDWLLAHLSSFGGLAGAQAEARVSKRLCAGD
jgi:hypothetical protein